MNPIRFERASVEIGESKIEGYKMPNGEFRVGITGASLALGYSKEWLGRNLSYEKDGVPTVAEKSRKLLGMLQGQGSDGCILQGEIKRKQGGIATVSTISLKDFGIVILYAAIKGKKEAIALQLALTQTTLNDLFREAFDLRPFTPAERRSYLKKEYQGYYKQLAASTDWRSDSMDEKKKIEASQHFYEGKDHPPGYTDDWLEII